MTAVDQLRFAAWEQACTCGQFFGPSGMSQEPHAIADGFSFLIAATRSFDPDPQWETDFMA